MVVECDVFKKFIDMSTVVFYLSGYLHHGSDMDFCYKKEILRTLCLAFISSDYTFQAEIPDSVW